MAAASAHQPDVLLRIAVSRPHYLDDVLEPPRSWPPHRTHLPRSRRHTYILTQAEGNGLPVGPGPPNALSGGLALMCTLGKSHSPESTNIGGVVAVTITSAPRTASSAEAAARTPTF